MSGKYLLLIFSMIFFPPIGQKNLFFSANLAEKKSRTWKSKQTLRRTHRCKFVLSIDEDLAKKMCAGCLTNLVFILKMVLK